MADREPFNIMEFLPYLLNRAAEETSLEFQENYRNRYGMLRTEWRVLFHLGKYDLLTANDIVNMAGIHKTKVSRAVQALAAKGYLKRIRDNDDRRREVLQLTKSGGKVYESLCLEAARFEEKITRELEVTDIVLIKKLLRRLAAQN